LREITVKNGTTKKQTNLLLLRLGERALHVLETSAAAASIVLHYSLFWNISLQIILKKHFLHIIYKKKFQLKWFVQKAYVFLVKRKRNVYRSWKKKQYRQSKVHIHTRDGSDF
jgi:hypothetical protein